MAQSFPEEAPSIEAPSEEASSKEAQSKEASNKEAPSKEASSKEAPSKEAPSEEAPSEKSLSEKALTWVKANPLAGFLLIVEIIFFVIYGLLVEYDEGGLPGQEYEEALSLANTSDGINVQRAQDYLLRLQSTRSTTKLYPCE